MMKAAAALILSISCFGPTALRAGEPGSVVYATVYGAGIASFDARTGRRIGFLRSGAATGLARDGAGNLYVGHTSPDPASFVVRVFAPGAPTPTRIIETRQQFGTLAASSTGELAVAGSGAGECCSNALEFFVPGHPEPYRHIVPTRELVGFDYVAFDASGNCWVDGYDAKHRAVIGYVPPGSFRVTFVPFAGLTSAGPLAIDGVGNVVVAGPGGLIQVFAPNGAIQRRWLLADRPGDTTAIAVSSDDLRLYVADGDTLLAAYRYDADASRPSYYFGSYASGVAVGD